MELRSKRRLGHIIPIHTIAVCNTVACKRRVTPRRKRTDVLLPLGVPGQGGATHAARGPRDLPTAPRAEFRRGQNYATNGYGTVYHYTGGRA